MDLVNWFEEHLRYLFFDEFTFNITPMYDAGTYRPGISITAVSRFHAGDSFRKQPCTYEKSIL
jgi:hypothetical protein